MILGQAHKREAAVIFGLVLALHLLVIFFLALGISPMPISKKRPKLVVETVSLTPSRQKPAVKEKHIAEELPAPVLKPPEPQEHNIPKEASKTESRVQHDSKTVISETNGGKQKPLEIKKTEKTPAAPKKEEPARGGAKASAIEMEKRKTLLANAQASIAKMEKASAKGGAAQVAEAVDMKIPIFGQGDSAEDYKEVLALRLKKILTLPEKGTVEIKLTLERSGAFHQLDIQVSESAKNREYVQNMVPRLLFPPLSKPYSQQNRYTFSIKLTSEI